MTTQRLLLEARLAGLTEMEWDYEAGPGVKCTTGKGHWTCAARGATGRDALENLLRRMRVIK